MPHRVLVVDDEEAIRDLLQEYLEGQGFRVFSAADGEEGIASFESTRPDLALIDFLLPKKNGFAVADAIRRSDRAGVPIIMMSGVFKNPKTAVEAKEKYQVVEFLTKPIDLERLTESIRAAIAASPAVSRDPMAVGSVEDIDSGPTVSASLRNRPVRQGTAPGMTFSGSLEFETGIYKNGVGPSSVGEIVDGVYHGRPFPELTESGSLEAWPVALLLSTIRYDRVTGMLDMNNDSGTHRRIYVIDGNPTFMQSNAEGENVGALLLARGRITEPDFERCLRYMKDRSRTLQQSLLEMRLVTEADLATAYKLLAGQLLPLALGMASGTYQWRSSDAFVGRVPEGRFEPVQVLFEGIKKHVHPPQILKFFKEREDVPLVPTGEFNALLPSFQRVFGRSTVAAEVDGDATYRQLTRSHAVNAATTVPQLFALVTSGMTVLPEVTDDNALEVAVNVAAAQLEDLAPDPFDHEVGISAADRKAQAVVERYHAEIMSQDFFQIFAATPESSDDEIKTAYFELTKRWHADVFAGRRLGRAQHKLDEVFARITEAYETITDGSQRSEYMAYIDRKKKGLPTDIGEIHRGEQLFEQATAMIRRRDFASAKQVLEEATRLNPDPIYFATLGWVIFNIDPHAPSSLSRAMKLLKKAVQEQENLPVAYQYLGSIAYARGNPAEAQKWWQRCLEWEPQNIDAARGLRLLASRQGKPSSM